jgi:anaerobic magnesium-protoporphyrin IX monomethyl ester cyclase
MVNAEVGQSDHGWPVVSDADVGGSFDAVRPQRTEPIHTAIDYPSIDRCYDHSSRYAHNFASRVAPTFHRLTGRTVRAGVPVEIGRGCIKFARSDACSFCSIQYGDMWRNAVPDADTAGDPCGHLAGYDYPYLTADELPLTFGGLLRRMRTAPPAGGPNSARTNDWSWSGMHGPTACPTSDVPRPCGRWVSGISWWDWTRARQYRCAP